MSYGEITIWNLSHAFLDDIVLVINLLSNEFPMKHLT